MKKKVLAQRAILEAVTGATDVMLVYLDPDFNFVWVNNTYAQTCQMRLEEMIGRNHF
jgi:transcriptional regulator with PAS, ATPase and Fis domain